MTITLSDYLDPNQFPATTDPDIDPRGQFRIDAFNYDSLRRWIEEGNELSPDQVEVWQELSIKIPAQKYLSKEID
jgi:hypothetical protein